MGRTGTFKSYFAAFVLLTGISGWAGSARAVDFVRGDANGDGVVTLADAQAILSYLFRFQPLACLDAADANASAQGILAVDISDIAAVVSHLFPTGGWSFRIPPPYPEPGPFDPSRPGWNFDCGSYGGVPPLDDPGARIRVLDTETPGGDCERAKVTLSISSSRTLAGFSGTLLAGDGILSDSGGLSRSNNESSFAVVVSENGSARFGYLSSYINPTNDRFIPAGEDVQTFAFNVQLKPGTPAGDYPLRLEAAELIDWETSRAIVPDSGTGTLRLLAPVTASGGCGEVGSGAPLNAVYRLGTASAVNGEEASMPFTLRVDREVEGFEFTIDFDEDVLECLWIDYRLYAEYTQIAINNDRRIPGSGGVDEGFLYGALIFDWEEPYGNTATLPPNQDHLAAMLRFRVRPEAPSGPTPVRFVAGSRVGTEFLDSFILVAGAINILDDITIFVRGDSNSDLTVDLSDAQTILSYLFLGGPRPWCFDAADFNDDGAIDLTDPVATLNYLFLGNTAPPDPFAEPGADPTADTLGCLRRS